MIALSFFLSQVLAIFHPYVVATLGFSYENLDDISTGKSLTVSIGRIVHVFDHRIQIFERLCRFNFSSRTLSYPSKIKSFLCGILFFFVDSAW